MVSALDVKFHKTDLMDSQVTSSEPSQVSSEPTEPSQVSSSESTLHHHNLRSCNISQPVTVCVISPSAPINHSEYITLEDNEYHDLEQVIVSI